MVQVPEARAAAKAVIGLLLIDASACRTTIVASHVPTMAEVANTARSSGITGRYDASRRHT